MEKSKKMWKEARKHLLQNKATLKEQVVNQKVERAVAMKNKNKLTVMGDRVTEENPLSTALSLEETTVEPNAKKKERDNSSNKLITVSHSDKNMIREQNESNNVALKRALNRFQPITRDHAETIQLIEQEAIKSIRLGKKETACPDEEKGTTSNNAPNLPKRKEKVSLIEPTQTDSSDRGLNHRKEDGKQNPPSLSEIRKMTTKDLLKLIEITIQAWEKD